MKKDIMENGKKKNLLVEAAWTSSHQVYTTNRK
jgi:hypothetical protein